MLKCTTNDLYSDLQNRVAAGMIPAFPEHTFSVLRGLGQRLNKQKTLISTEAKMSVFLIWRAICIACYYYTKFGITTSIWIASLAQDHSTKKHTATRFETIGFYVIFHIQILKCYVGN